MKRSIGITLLLVLMAAVMMMSLAGCTKSDVKDAVAAGDEALAAKDFEEALSQYQFAADNGYYEDGFKEKLEAVSAYCEASSYLEADDIEKAEQAAAGIDGSVDVAVEDSLALLNAEINVRKEEIASNDAELENIKNYIESAKFTEAQKKIDDLKNKELSLAQQERLENLTTNLRALSAVSEQAKQEVAEQLQQAQAFSADDAVREAQSYIEKMAASDNGYLKYSVRNAEGPYTDGSGNKYFSVPVYDLTAGDGEADFCIEVFADGRMEEIDY